MKSVLISIFLITTITICKISCQVGNQNMELFFEYLRPFWRLHRARLRPFVFVDPAPVWRVARDVERNY